MSVRAYYNEIDRYAAQWLRNLITAGHLVPGDVDERSIADVQPGDLAGYDQCHFFAGIGGWPYSLRLAGWPDEWPVWTGSCPCQPLSSAGQRKGHADERHLWPAFYRLIAERRPAIVFGEQVAGALGREWLAGVRADLEGAGYAIGAADLCAAGVGAPHIRQRLYWLADADAGWQGRECGGLAEPEGAAIRDSAGQRHRLRHPIRDRANGGMATTEHDGRHAAALAGGVEPRQGKSGLRESEGLRNPSGRLGDTGASRLPAPEREDLRRAGRRDEGRATAEPSSSRAFWDRGELIPCLDGKVRRGQPGIFPLAHGVPDRVGKLRGAGNAIVPQVAAEFVMAFMECRAADVFGEVA